MSAPAGTRPVNPPRGATPLVRLQRVPLEHTLAQIHVKCEWMNPAGSVKDRPAARMVQDAQARGLLDGRRGILDSTSGNTGIALAQIGASWGHKVTLCLPANTSPVRLRLLRLLGAHLILTPAMDGPDGARAAAQDLARTQPQDYVYLDQYANPMNWRAHYDTTAVEIWEQTQGNVTHFVSILGTSGTFTGVSRRLLELKPSVQRIAVQPNAAYHGIEGSKHYASSDVPPIFDPSLMTAQVEVSTEDAQAMARQLAALEGLPAGISGGAAVVAALQVAKGLKDSDLVVAVLPDHVIKSLMEAPWDVKHP